MTSQFGAFLQNLLQDAGAKLTTLGICTGDMLWVHLAAGDSAAPMECEQPAMTAATRPGSGRSSLAAAMPPARPPPRQVAADAAEARRQAAVQVIFDAWKMLLTSLLHLVHSSAQRSSVSSSRGHQQQILLYSPRRRRRGQANDRSPSAQSLRLTWPTLRSCPNTPAG